MNSFDIVEPKWYHNRDSVAITAKYMVEQDYNSNDIADMIRNPWRYEAEFEAAKDDKAKAS